MVLLKYIQCHSSDFFFFFLICYRKSCYNTRFAVFIIYYIVSYAVEVIMFECNIIYKFVQELHFFVARGDDENELILATLLQGFFDKKC
ncbi:hypothetical protein RchiOBHm_Chr5g0078651 [Rosa chinensis]|uniref:Uncharacterized protein n=1 Tax=Rosa chinensis TaxID=74649 RepID=A0A2P6QMC5_ROSCH|nr:hypothetical protein RchiOBHm_Chr5g0078651 [Rosa chinensis]